MLHLHPSHPGLLSAICLVLLRDPGLGGEPGDPPTPETVLAWQAALEARGFSPGLVDGRLGRKTRMALLAFQRSAQLPATGELDALTFAALGLEGEPVTREYTISAEDEAQVSYCPPDWHERSRRERLLYPTLLNCLAERFHTSERCLGELNPGRDLTTLKSGDVLRVPALWQPGAPPSVTRLEIDLSHKLVLLLGPNDALLGLLHCSVARELSSAVRGDCSVAVVVKDPNYTFDPKKWPEVKDVTQKLTIPPGPRCPVGIRWIGLDRPGVGLHGTPEPEHIGKTGSHGCFRLTNWDAAWLASAVKVGTPVRVVDASKAAAALAQAGK